MVYLEYVFCASSLKEVQFIINCHMYFGERRSKNSENNFILHFLVSCLCYLIGFLYGLPCDTQHVSTFNLSSLTINIHLLLELI